MRLYFICSAIIIFTGCSDFTEKQEKDIDSISEFLCQEMQFEDAMKRISGNYEQTLRNLPTKYLVYADEQYMDLLKQSDQLSDEMKRFRKQYTGVYPDSAEVFTYAHNIAHSICEASEIKTKKLSYAKAVEGSLLHVWQYPDQQGDEFTEWLRACIAFSDQTQVVNNSNLDASKYLRKKKSKIQNFGFSKLFFSKKDMWEVKDNFSYDYELQAKVNRIIDLIKASSRKSSVSFDELTDWLLEQIKIISLRDAELIAEMVWNKYWSTETIVVSTRGGKSFAVELTTSQMTQALVNKIEELKTRAPGDESLDFKNQRKQLGNLLKRFTLSDPLARQIQRLYYEKRNRAVPLHEYIHSYFEKIEPMIKNLVYQRNQYYDIYQKIYATKEKLNLNSFWQSMYENKQKKLHISNVVTKAIDSKVVLDFSLPNVSLEKMPPYFSPYNLGFDKEGTTYLMYTASDHLEMKKIVKDIPKDVKLNYRPNLPSGYALVNPSIYFNKKGELFCLINITNGEDNEVKLLKFTGSTFSSNFSLKEEISITYPHLSNVHKDFKKAIAIDIDFDLQGNPLISLIQTSLTSESSINIATKYSLYRYSFQEKEIALCFEKEIIDDGLEGAAFLPVDCLAIQQIGNQENWWALTPTNQGVQGWELHVSADGGKHWHSTTE